MRLLLASVCCALFSLSSARPECRCNGNFRTRAGKRDGECTTEIGGKWFCYVPEGACDDQRESNSGGLFYSFQACDTITAKFWVVTDLEVDPTSFADKAVQAMNTALTNSRIPLKYKRQGSVGTLRKSSEDVKNALGDNAKAREKYNRWFFDNGLGNNGRANEILKDGADHVVFLYNGGARGLCLTISSTPTIVMGTRDSTKSFEEILLHTFVHEAGHCLGGHHNREVPGRIQTGYSFAYCLPRSKYATIISYPEDCIGNQPRETILYFSNPDVRYRGIATGTSRDNNARKIKCRAVEKYKKKIAGFNFQAECN